MAGFPAVAAPVARPADGGEAGLWRGLDLEDRQGRSFQLGSAVAPMTLVTLWAHWCPPCLAEMGGLAAMAAAVGPRIDVLLISHPEYWVQDQAVAQQRRIPFRMATLSAANGPAIIRAALTQADGSYAVPRSMVFRTRDMAVAWRHMGSLDWASAGTIATVRALAG